MVYPKTHALSDLTWHAQVSHQAARANKEELWVYSQNFRKAHIIPRASSCSSWLRNPGLGAPRH